MRHSGQDTTTDFTSIGAMIFRLLYKLAWEDPSIRELAEYFSMVNLVGAGVGKPRPWDAEMYSEEVRKRLLSESLTSEKRWDEWSKIFDHLG
jgi:hypothetical protein